MLLNLPSSVVLNARVSHRQGPLSFLCLALPPSWLISPCLLPAGPQSAPASCCRLKIKGMLSCIFLHPLETLLYVSSLFPRTAGNTEVESTPSEREGWGAGMSRHVVPPPSWEEPSLRGEFLVILSWQARQPFSTVPTTRSLSLLLY